MKLSNLLCFVCFLSLLAIVPSAVFSSTVEDSWMNIYDSEKLRDPVGYSRKKIEKNGSVTTAYEKSEISVKAFETENKVSTEAEYVLDNGILKSFSYTLESYPNSYKIRGIKKNGKLLVTTETQASGKEEIYDLDSDFIVPPLLPSWLASGRLKSGKNYDVHLFDPFFLVSKFPKDRFRATLKVKEREQLEIGTESYQAYRVVFEYFNTVSEFWIKDDGTVLKEVIPPGFVSVKSTEKELAGKKLKSYDVVGKTSVKSPVEIKNPRETVYMKFRLDDGEGNLLEIGDGYIQVKEEDYYIIRTEPNPSVKPESDNSRETEKYLVPTNFVQSENDKIVSKQRSITEGIKDKSEGIMKIKEWLYKNIEKKPVFSIPDSLDVLQSMKGDCNEHSVLFAALARSYGVPVKIALGLVYVNGRFSYHAWNEVYLGEWVTVDSSFGQFPADATHIKLTEGGIEKSVDIINLAGKLNIEILEVY